MVLKSLMSLSLASLFAILVVKSVLPPRRLIREDKFRNSLLAADTPEKIIEIINNEES